jgi:hypothetical protein
MKANKETKTNSHAGAHIDAGTSHRLAVVSVGKRSREAVDGERWKQMPALSETTYARGCTKRTESAGESLSNKTIATMIINGDWDNVILRS